MDRYGSIPCTCRVGLRVSDAPIVSPWRAQKGSGERAGVIAYSKRCRWRADRSAHLAHRFATTFERRLSENDAGLGVEDRAAYNSGTINQGRGDSTRRESFGAT